MPASKVPFSAMTRAELTSTGIVAIQKVLGRSAIDHARHDPAVIGAETAGAG
jgi:hypothetical protein